MAATDLGSQEYFTVGSLVTCTTCLQATLLEYNTLKEKKGLIRCLIFGSTRRPGMTKMAATDLGSQEYFTVGSLVTCTTCLDTQVEGEVLAFDQHTKMLIIKSQSSSNRTTLNNVHM